MFFSIHNCISLYHNWVTLYTNISNSARPEVRGTAEFHGGAYPPCHTPTHTYSRLSSLFRCGPTG